MQQSKNYLRLFKTPPPSVPPAGCADIVFDFDEGDLNLRTADGNEVSILLATSIPDITSEAVPSTIAKRTLAGGLNCVVLSADSVLTGTEGVEVTPPEGITPSGALGLSPSTLVLVGTVSGKTATFTAGNNVLSADVVLTAPTATGTIPSVPSYADETAANAALSAGDFYWNVALGKLKTATA